MDEICLGFRARGAAPVELGVELLGDVVSDLLVLPLALAVGLLEGPIRCDTFPVVRQLCCVPPAQSLLLHLGSQSP